uniref:hypothetical protein n=1 Tax=Rheinheimera sp. TaxID=1869214 RepID=UPI004047AAD5
MVFGLWSLVFGLWSLDAASTELLNSRENPLVIECNTCFTSNNFELKAKSVIEINESKYVVVFNSDSQQFKSYFVNYINEPELGLTIHNANSLVNLNQHETKFAEYLDAKQSGILSDKPIELFYPKELAKSPATSSTAMQNYGSWARGQPSVNRALVVKMGNPFVTQKMQQVVIKFDNGHKVVLLVNPLSGSASVFVALLDKDNNLQLVGVTDNASTGASSGGGTESGNTNGSYRLESFTYTSGGSKTIRVCTGSGKWVTCYNLTI